MTMLQQTLAKLLGRRDKLDSATCKARLDEVAERLAEIDARQLEVDYNAGGRPGPVLKATLETGSPKDVVALADEVRLLDAERDSLLQQRDALQERRDAAIAEEALPVARALLKKLPATLSRVETLLAQLAEARDELDRQVEELVVARRVAKDGGHSPTAASSDLVNRIDAVQPTPSPNFRRTLLNALADQLPPAVVEEQRLDQQRWEREERERKDHAAVQARQRERRAS